MSRFEAEKGFVHLVFAQEDEYYLKSLICLNLNQFLYYKLKKEYDDIYFISGSQEEYQLEIPDPEGCGYYSEAAEKKGFLKFFGAEIQEIVPGEKKRIPQSQEEELRRRIFRILRKRKKQAFVFTIESFSELFREKETLEELRELEKKCLGKSILLVQIPPTAAGSFSWLAQESGWFRTWLCPGIFQEGNSRYEKIYVRIQEALGDRCSFLNELGRYEIRWMFRRYFLQNPAGAGKLYLADAYADFVYAWYHSEALRERTGGILPENEKRLMSQIRKSLERPGVLANLELWMTRFLKETEKQENLLEKIERECSMDQEDNYIYVDSQLLRKLNGAVTPQGHPAADRCREKIFRLRRELRIPRLGQQSLDTDLHLCACIRHLQEAGTKGDFQTYEKALDALEYGIFRAETIGEAAEEIWGIKDKIITLSEYVFLYTEEIRKADEQIAEFIQEKEKILQEIQQQEGKGKPLNGAFSSVRRAVNDPVSGDRLSLASQKERAVSLNKEIENHKKQRALYLQTKNSYSDRIRKLEQAASQMVLGNLSISDPEIDTTAEKLRENLYANLEASQRNRESAREMEIAMEEYLGIRLDEQMDEQEIAREYQKMFQEEDNEGREDITC